MNILAITELYGERVMVRPFYGDSFFFAGNQPPANRIVLLELPGLKALSPEAMREWIAARPKGLLEQIGDRLRNRRALMELPESCWRPAVLHDLMNADMYNNVSWRLSEQFDLRAFATFTARWLPEMQQRLAAALDQTEEQRAAEAIQLQDFLTRLGIVVYQLPNRVRIDREQTLLRIERARIAVLRQRPLIPDEWIALAGTLLIHQTIQECLIELVNRIVATDTAQQTLPAVLAQIGKLPELRRIMGMTPGFWIPIARTLRLEPTEHGVTLDITEATELRVPMGWDVLEGRRIGRIVPGRMALTMRDTQGRLVYVAGERRLKFQIARAGGRIEKYGCTLTVSGHTRNQMHQALLEVDLLETLVHVDPAQALERVAHLNLPADHPVYQAAAALPHDPRQARILADLLIEVAVQVDADVARRLARAQARGNRR